MTTPPSSQAAMQASDGTPTPSDRDSVGQGAGARADQGRAPASLGLPSVPVIITKAGRFRIVGDDFETVGAVIIFPDGPPEFTFSVVWDRELLFLSRSAIPQKDKP